MKTEYDAIITNMAKLLEVQQKRELVAVDMIAAASRHGAGCVKSGKGRASRVGAGTAGRGARSAAVLAARLAFCDMARAPLFAWRLFEAL